MNFLAFSMLALWQADLHPLSAEPVAIPVANMVRSQREEAINDILLWVQADLKRSTARQLKRPRSPRPARQQVAILAQTCCRDTQ